MDTSNVVDNFEEVRGSKKGDSFNVLFCIFGNELATHFVPKHNYGDDLVIFER